MTIPVLLRGRRRLALTVALALNAGALLATGHAPEGLLDLGLTGMWVAATARKRPLATPTATAEVELDEQVFAPQKPATSIYRVSPVLDDPPPSTPPLSLPAPTPPPAEMVNMVNDAVRNALRSMRGVATTTNRTPVIAPPMGDDSPSDFDASDFDASARDFERLAGYCGYVGYAEDYQGGSRKKQ